MTIQESRRKFLRSAPLAAVGGLGVKQPRAYAEDAVAGYQVFAAAALEADAAALATAPGNKSLAANKNLTVVMTVEKAKAAKEFEWHEGRDHVLQVLEGETSYELGGVAKNGRMVKTGEWLAPESEGAATIVLKKGDMLVVPRGTPHKRTTVGSVTFLLISGQE